MHTRFSRDIPGHEGGRSPGMFALGALVGALVMLVLDPRRGRARRAFLAQKVESLARNAREQIRRKAKDTAQRARGRRYELAHADEIVPDDLLVERVRAHIGRPVTHARTLQVEVHGGCVVLSGPILRQDVDRLLKAVNKVRGVKAVESRLDVRDSADDVPGLRG